MEFPCVVLWRLEALDCRVHIPQHVHMAHFQLGSFLIGLVSNWAQF